MERKNKDLLKIVIFGVLILVIIFLTLIAYDNFIVLEKQKVYTSFIASDHPGFDLNLTALTFGMVPVGQSSGRGIFLTNDFKKKIKVIIKSSGEISDFLIVSENQFYLSPREEKKIDFSVILPKDLEFKKYEGEIEIIFKRF